MVGSMTNFQLVNLQCIKTIIRLHSSMSLKRTLSGRATCGIVVIGDEVLSGSVTDTNSTFLSRNLHSLGVNVCKISVIGDDVQAIADEVKTFSNNYEYVITSGGIGPTHDDVTFKGVGLAFDEDLYPHPELIEFCRKWFKTDELSPAAMKLTQVPVSAKLNYASDIIAGKKMKFPIVSVQNVYVFPGVPYLLEKGFNLISKKLFADDMKRYSAEIFLSTDEVSIAATLNCIVEQFPRIKFGSYPQFFHSYYKTRISAEADEDVQPAMQQLCKELPKDVIVNFDKTPTLNMYEKLEVLMRDNVELKECISQAINTIEKCYEQYSPEEVVVCFNGGKDCTAVLHLTAAVLSHLHPDAVLQAVYIRESNHFPQVTEFTRESTVRYNMSLDEIKGPMKQGLMELLEKKPSIKAAIMGTRSSDPYTDGQSAFSATDSDWPPFMRVNPLLHWSYSQIWKLIRKLYLPYCNLYDRGYTSLGSMENTFPNPKLYNDKATLRRYKPAYKLDDESAEREGRL